MYSEFFSSLYFLSLRGLLSFEESDDRVGMVHDFLLEFIRRIDLNGVLFIDFLNCFKGHIKGRRGLFGLANN